MNDLNKEQLQAATQLSGPLLILAGAGSGKTKTVTYRMANMLLNHKIDAKSILAVTFTNKAAKEMKERLIKLIGKKATKECPTVCTFHSLGVQILRKEIDKLGYSKKFTIYDSSDQMGIIREILSTYKADKAFDRKRIQSKISWLKNRNISQHQYEKHEDFDYNDAYDLATAYTYQLYQEKLHFYNAIDFDDILFLCNQLFIKFPDLALKYSQLYQYIMIDEYQDTNDLQLEIIYHLTKTHKNICVVGDDDQSIYSFRGANVSNILKFDQHFKGANVIKLTKNYRSTQSILDLANMVIGAQAGRHDKKMEGMLGIGTHPLLWDAADPEHEGALICDEIQKIQKNGELLSEIAILYRSNTQVPELEDQLKLAMIPYQIIGGQKLFEKKEVKDVIAYLCLILNTKDEISLRRVINLPHRGVGPKLLEEIIDHAAEKRLSLFDGLKNALNNLQLKNQTNLNNFVHLIENYQKRFNQEPLANVIESLINELNFNQIIEKNYDQPHQIARRKADLSQFVLSAQRFFNYHQNQATLGDFVERMLLQDQPEDNNNENGIKNEVTLMTLHSAKGLEFDTIFFAGVEEDLIPHKKTIQENGDLNEERRLFYVGVTRAKKRLIMTKCKERILYGKKHNKGPSRFINELTQFYTKQDRTTLGHLTEIEAKTYKKNFFEDLAKNLD